MPDEPNAPSAGAGQGTGSGAPPPSTPEPTSDRELIDQALPAEEPSGAELAPEKPATEDAAQTAQRAEEAEREKLIPAELRELFRSKPDLKPWRDAFFSDRAYRQLFPEISQARELRQLIPSVEDAKRMLEEAQNYGALVDSYESDPRAFLEQLKEQNGDAFNRLLGETVQLSRELPEYQQKRAQERESFVQTALEAALDHAERNGDEELKAAVDALSRAWFGGPFQPSRQPRESSREAQLRQREEALNQREQRAKQTAAREFMTSMQDNYVERTLEAIAGQVQQLLPDASEGQRKRVVKEIFTEVDRKLGENTNVVREIQRRKNSLSSSGRYSEEARNEMVEFLAKRAQAILPQIASQVISEWTKDVLGANRELLDRQRQTAARTQEPGTGGRGTTVTTAPVIKPGATDREMLDQVLGTT